MATPVRPRRGDWTQDDACRLVPCAWCGAQPGRQCRTTSGRTTTAHAERWSLAWEQDLIPLMVPGPYTPPDEP